MRIAVLDIGGTAIKSGLWNGESFEDIKETESKAKEGGPALIQRAIDLLHQYEPMDAIGISTAGEVDVEQGKIYYANDNIPNYTGMEVCKIIEDIFHVPVALENDVNSAALGEIYAGAAQKCKDFLCLTYGTGVGGAIVIDGEIYRGANHCAGCFGAIVLRPELQTADDPLKGCYERLASTSGLVNRCVQIDPALTTGRKIFEAMNRLEIREQIDGWIDDIAIGLASIIAVFNPSTIVLGGGVMSQTYIFEQLLERVQFRTIESLRTVKIIPAKLGNMAGMYGAVSLAIKKLNKL